MSASLNVKYGSSQSYTINVELSWTVAEVKKTLETVSTISSDLQRLIYAGQVMNNERTLESYNVKDGHTVHLVCRKPPAQSQPTQPSAQPTQPQAQTQPQPQPQPQTQPQPQPQPQFPPVQPQFPTNFNFNSFTPQAGVHPSYGLPINPAVITNLLSDPNIQNVLAQVFQNPQLLQQMLQSDPLAQAYLSNPAVAAALQNPGFLRQMSDPAVLQGLYGALAGGPGTGAAAGAFGGAGGAFGDTMGGGSGVVGGGEAVGGGTSGTSGGSTSGAGTVPVGGGAAGNVPGFTAFPPFFGTNPFFGGIPTTQNPQGGQSGVGVNPGFNPNPAAQPNFTQMFSGMSGQQPPEQRFAIQLQQLQDMGFYNQQLNIQILTSTFGNVEAAVERLLRG
eukprot:TRINITY_DN6837_c0_g1_i5.p1 TRINITY_DN6837_c0_g1~~TRINITY_DN6837_c0_g1_i5.p1  ORF type:complete len:389 (+),score=103.45 TRINITY_DN6837_c0_g1_i5:191-1357(+)